MHRQHTVEEEITGRPSSGDGRARELPAGMAMATVEPRKYSMPSHGHGGTWEPIQTQVQLNSGAILDLEQLPDTTTTTVAGLQGSHTRWQCGEWDSPCEFQGGTCDF